MSHRIEIDDDVFASLLELRGPHESPSSVIRRLLQVPAKHAPFDVIPIQQPAAEDLRNAIQSLAGWLGTSHQGEADWGGNDITRARDLVQAALVKLGEPSHLTIKRTLVLLDQLVTDLQARGLDTTPTEREARDIAAVALTAQLEGR